MTYLAVVACAIPACLPTALYYLAGVYGLI